MAFSKGINKREEEWNNFRKNFRRMQVEAGLSGREMAELVGVSPNYISKIHCGHAKPSQTTAEKIADCFGVSASSLFYDENMAKAAEWKAFSNAVKNARQAKGWSLEYTAHILKLDPVDYRIVEKGDREISGPIRRNVCSLFDLNTATGKPKTATIKPKAEEETKKAEIKRPSSTRDNTATPAKETAEMDLISCEMIEVIIKGVRKLPASTSMQKEIFRTFSELRIRKEEKALFG